MARAGISPEPYAPVDDEQEYWLGRMLRWVMRRLGVDNVLLLSLLLLAFTSMAYGLAHLIQGIETNLPWTFCALGLLASWNLSRPGVKALPAAVLTLAFGLLAALLIIGQTGDTLASAASALLTLAATNSPAASLAGLQTPTPQWNQMLTSLWEVVTQIAALLARSSAWASATLQGQARFDPVSLAFAWSGCVYLAAAWAGWWVKQKRNPLVGLLPAAAVLGASLSYTRGPTVYLLLFLAALLGLLGLTSYLGREQHWQRQRVDYSDEIRSDIAVALSALTLTLTLLAAASPSLSPERVRAFLERWRPPATAGEGAAETGLGLKPPAAPPNSNTFSDLRLPGLPRDHLLRAGPELSQEWVMTVSTGELPPRPSGVQELEVPRHYWRGLTYDRYTGFGWASNNISEAVFPADTWTIPQADSTRQETLQPELGSGMRLLRQEVTFAAGKQGVILAGGELLTLDQDFRVAWYHAPGEQATGLAALLDADLFGATKAQPETPREGGILRYTAWSVETRPDAQDLRQAGERYPGWVVARYLQLPQGLPDRVRVLARNLTAAELTPYDRVQAIEGYLRTYAYTLDLPAPPPNRDVVDYFLFDLRQGYCDYYASSMVVLARAAGVPARLAMGYASGTYDPNNAAYTVNEDSAHSWPEVYFPGYGWVIFEPTAGQPLLEHAQSPSDLLPALPVPAPPTPRAPLSPGRLLAWLALAGLGGGYLLLAWNFLESWRLRRLPPAEAGRRLFRRLVRRARSLGVVPLPARTPLEWNGELETRLSLLSQAAPWNRWLRRSSQDAASLTGLYNQAQYSASGPAPEDRDAGVQTWRRLRWRLLLATLANWLRRRKPDASQDRILPHAPSARDYPVK